MIKLVKPSSPAEKATRTTTDTILVTRKVLEAWKEPGFQRQPKVNEKVKTAATRIKASGGIIPGVIHLAVIGGVVYLLDGQHRRIASLMTDLPEFLCDTVTHFCANLAEAGRIFREINSSLVRPKADDYLRAMEGSTRALQAIREKCPFVGYDMIRRGTSAPIMSMSTTIRAWFGSEADVPVSSGPSAVDRIDQLNDEITEQLIGFLLLCFRAWGRDHEFKVLWGSLNFTICAWLYRRTVLAGYSGVSQRLTRDDFRDCMAALSADSEHLGWLVNRQLTEQQRAPAYKRIKKIFGARLSVDDKKKPKLPAPAWANE